MGNYTIFRCSKILEEAGKQEIYNKCSENSRSQIVFRTDIFRKLTLGAPVPVAALPPKKYWPQTQEYRQLRRLHVA